MSSTRCPTLNWLLLPLFLVVATVIVGTTTSRLESVLLYTLTAAFTLAHIHYGVQVVSDRGQGRTALGNTEGGSTRWGTARGLLSVALGRWRASVRQGWWCLCYSNHEWLLTEWLWGVSSYSNSLCKFFFNWENSSVLSVGPDNPISFCFSASLILVLS